MALSAGTGVSSSRDSRAAGREAAREALKNAQLDNADLAIVFSSPLFDQAQMVAGVAEALGDTPFVGCTSAGAITERGVHEQAVAVLVLKSDEGRFFPVKVENIGADMRAAGKAFAEELGRAGSGEVKMALMFSDALAGNGTELVRGVFEGMGDQFPLGGGAAGDDLQFKKTYQFYNREVLTNAVVGVGIAGNVAIAAGSDHGWQPIGMPRIATNASGMKLMQLDGKPAFSIYEEYFGDRAADFKQTLSLAGVSYPLGMKTKGQGDQPVIRLPLSVGSDGSIICGAEIVEGSEIYLMIGTLSAILHSAEHTMRSVADRLPPGRRIVLVSDCIARKILLGERGAEEIALLRSIVGPETVIFGFYSYGQIAPLRPLATDTKAWGAGFYEQSISLTAFGT